MTTCITTFSKDGYELYGHTMITTWLQFWPPSFKLIVYTEGYTLAEKDERIIELNINESCPNLVTFKDKSNNKLLETSDKKEKRRIQKTIKWCHKVYAIDHALKTINDDYIIFLDGDTYTIDAFADTLPATLVNDKLFAVHFEKLKDGLHFETGLIVFNKSHRQMEILKEFLTSGYDSLNIYNENKTWDGYWFARLYRDFKLDLIDLSLEGRGVFGNKHIRNILRHDIGSKKYNSAGYNHFTGRKE